MGLVKKAGVKTWLDYLEFTPLYRLYNIGVDMKQSEDKSDEHQSGNLDFLDKANDGESLLRNQHTMLWSEDKFLEIAPGKNSIPVSIIYDEHAEELPFPDIHYGVGRKFRVTPFQIDSSEIRRMDRRGATPEHILYMTLKIHRLRVASGVHASFRYRGDLSKISREMIEDNRFIEQCVSRSDNSLFPLFLNIVHLGVSKIFLPANCLSFRNRVGG